MSTTETAPPQAHPLAGRKFRFEAKSAEEAIRTIQKRLGDTAKVLSVKQIGGKGLHKFLSSPKLEIIARVPLPEEEASETLTEVAPAAPASVPTPAPEATLPTAPAATPPTSTPLAQSQQAAMPSLAEMPEMAAPAPSPAQPSIPDTPYQRPSTQPLDLKSILLRSGFDEELYEQFRSTPSAQSSDHNLGHVFGEFYHWLKKQFDEKPQYTLTNRVAFLGSCGSGKTTALCKLLSHHTLFQEENIEVYKLDSESPNPDDALTVFCEIMGTQLHRDPQAIPQLPAERRIYLDSPGINWHDLQEVSNTKAQLDQLQITSRVLVLNAAYDSELLKEALWQGKNLGVTHLILTHLDEVRQTGKLWSLLLKNSCTALMFSYGQSITSDYTQELFPWLCNKTFPSELTRSK